MVISVNLLTTNPEKYRDKLPRMNANKKENDHEKRRKGKRQTKVKVKIKVKIKSSPAWHL
ncbi:MAG: hypothetical protein COT43_11525 [Candidatus Marinimicrobia bacterium CG08_land_8_20_14_0_20_45_22]|nr:MAG: hypothetical protein COT43_11525 [Candidatus Marinimicrobia bacterium CG08_land_8_20_14_0_20_45_22]